jgi:hypothetical protein
VTPSDSTNVLLGALGESALTFRASVNIFNSISSLRESDLLRLLVEESL